MCPNSTTFSLPGYKLLEKLVSLMYIPVISITRREKTDHTPFVLYCNPHGFTSLSLPTRVSLNCDLLNESIYVPVFKNCLKKQTKKQTLWKPSRLECRFVFVFLAQNVLFVYLFFYLYMGFFFFVFIYLCVDVMVIPQGKCSNLITFLCIVLWENGTRIKFIGKELELHSSFRKRVGG